MNIRRSIAALAALSASAVMAAVVTPGEIGDDFASGLAYAEAHCVPIAVTWGNTSCGYCNTLSDTLAESEELRGWIADKKIVFVEKHEEYGCTDADYLAAQNWINSLGKKESGHPYLGLYWKQADGSVVKAACLARKNKLPVKTPKNNLSAQLVGTLEMYFGDYDGKEQPGPDPKPSVSGDANFITADTEEDRLEATIDTDTVYVPVRRETSIAAACNLLTVGYPDGSEKTISVNWAAGESNKYVSVEMPERFVRGKRVSLTLQDASGSALDSSFVAMVADYENSPTNPHWIGEYGAGSLPYGEWTLDYETAKEKLENNGGYIVACFSGVKWCPHCIGIDDSLFADRKFYVWAKKNRVILVLFDQPRFNSAEGCQYVGPRLLSYNNEFGKSGASYLSRKGLRGDDPEVLAAMDMQWELTRRWLAPESSAYRLSNPTVVLLNRAGDGVAARMKTYELADRSFPTKENLNRLNDLLSLVDADECEGYRTVTPLAFGADEAWTTELHVNAGTKYAGIDGVAAGEYVQAIATGLSKSAQPVTVSLCVGTNVVASGIGRAVTPRALTSAEASALSIRLSSFGASAEYGANNAFGVAVSATAGDEELVKTVNISTLSKQEQKTLNPALYVKRSATVPVLAAINLGGLRLDGSIAVSVTSANRISAKFSGDETVSFSGTWQQINLLTGVVSAKLVKGTDILELSMDVDGGIAAKLLDDDGEVGSGCSLAVDVANFVGRYTVTLVDVTKDNGTASLSVSVAKSGKATVKGTMPDGTSVSISTTLAPQADGTATLPLYKVSKDGTFSAALSMKANAADTWGSRGGMDTVATVTGCLAYWDDGESTEFSVFGGYWENGTSALEACEDFDLSDRLAVVVAGSTNAMVSATKSGFKPDSKEFISSLSLTKSTGVFSGKAKVVNSLGKTVNATIKGVLLPGWIDCGGCGDEPSVERPFGSGTIYYNEGGEVISKPLDLMAEDAD